MDLILGIQHPVLHKYLNNELGLIMTFLRQGQIWENAKTLNSIEKLEIMPKNW